MNYQKNVSVIIPSELLYAFDPDDNNTFIAAREHGLIVLHPLATSSANPCKFGRSQFQKGYLAGMSDGYDKGYSDALDSEDDMQMETVLDPNCAGFCPGCPHYDDLFDTCRFYY